MPLIPSPAVVRAGDLLTHLAAHPTRVFTVTELARHAGIPRATCSSLLLGLAEHGFVRRDAALRYALGPACIVVGDAARAAKPALRAAAVHAEALARARSLVVAVTMSDGDQTRVANVFDFGPPFGIRPRAGDTIALAPPFGASFVAWDDDRGIRAWLGRAQPPLTPAEVARYHAALEAVRRRGYSITVATARQPALVAALELLADEPDADEARRLRDQAIGELAHSEYLAAEVDPEKTARLTQISAPVFDPDGGVTVSIMLLGPAHEVTGAEIAILGQLVLAAATRATGDIGGLVPTPGPARGSARGGPA
jgi:DNA-binding IclR family transcriptional regulator